MASRMLAANPVSDEAFRPYPLNISFTMKLLLMWSWFCFTVFVFTLPFQSMLFNDVMNYWELCHTPAEEIKCYGDKTFLEIARSYRGTWADRWRPGPNGTRGHYIGCGCTEGVFADWMCSIKTVERSGITSSMLGFTVSYYIGTAPVTGAMAGFSAFPIAAMWWYGLGNVAVARHRFGPRAHGASLVYRFTWISLLLFQCCYFVFLTCTGCIYGISHLLAVNAFLGSAIVHFGGIAYLSWGKSRSVTSNLICKVITFAIISMSLGFVSYLIPELHGYGFFLAEAAGLSAMYFLTPALAVWGETVPVDTQEMAPFEGNTWQKMVTDAWMAYCLVVEKEDRTFEQFVGALPYNAQNSNEAKLAKGAAKKDVDVAVKRNANNTSDDDNTSEDADAKRPKKKKKKAD